MAILNNSRPQRALVQTAQEQKHLVVLRMSRVFVRFFFWNVNRPFAGIVQVSVYLFFLRGLRRKRSSAKGFRESL